MKCPFCPEELRVTHTYTEGQTQTRRSVCRGCRKVFTGITVVREAEEVGGAAAAAAAIRSGADPLEKLTSN